MMTLRAWGWGREEGAAAARSGPGVSEPPAWDVLTTRLLGRTVVRPYWRGWVRRLELRAGQRVLDFGSGSGQLSRLLAEAVGPGGHLTCLDISLRWLAIAGRETADLPWVDVRLGTPAQMPERAYDLVHAHYVLHALPRGTRGDVLEALRARLAAGGRLAVREPLYYGTLYREELLALASRMGLRTESGPARRWWLAGPVTEVVFVREEALSDT